MSRSSLFLEHPFEDSRVSESFNYKLMVSRLEYQLSSEQTEKKLLQQEKDTIVANYEKLLLKKSDEYNKLKANFDYLYEDKKQSESRAENQYQIADSTKSSLSKELDSVKQEKVVLSKKYQELDSSHNRLVHKYEHIKSDLNYQLKANDDTQVEILTLKNTIQQLYQTNDGLVEQLTQHSKQLTSDSSVHRLNQNLNNKNAALQKINSQLQLKIDTLLQNKTSLELLKQKNISLTNKITTLLSVEEKYCNLEIEHLKLTNKFNDFFASINDALKDESGALTNEAKVRTFIEKFNLLQYQLLVYKDKYEGAQLEINELNEKVYTLQHNVEDLQAEILSKLETNKSDHETIAKLERQKLLNTKEIEYLRHLLKELDEINSKQHKIDNKSTNQYLTNLEKLVDDYRKEINSLLKQLQANSHQQEPEIKRQKVSIFEDPYKTQLQKLEGQNIKLLSDKKQLESQIKNLNQHVLNSKSIDTKKEQVRVLQLKSNPASLNQIVKQETLDVLRRENKDLIDKYVNQGSVESIPRTVFERQENDNALLQNKVDELSKRISRLKQIYGQKSKDILSIISKYFGYTIEFLPSPINPNELFSRVKLVSRYSSSENTYLIIDIETKSLKAYGNFEFKGLYEQLLSTYDKEQIPCFLSALNLKLYEKSLVA